MYAYTEIHNNFVLKLRERVKRSTNMPTFNSFGVMNFGRNYADLGKNRRAKNRSARTIIKPNAIGGMCY